MNFRPQLSGPLTRLGLLFATLVFAADQLSKFWILRTLPLQDSRTLTSFLSLTHVQNTGAAFGLFIAASCLMRWLIVKTRVWKRSCGKAL